MLERPDAHDGRRDADQDAKPRKVLTIRPLTDREVPIQSVASASIGDMPVAVHQWLDGDVSERSARRADNENVEFWSRIATETSRRSRMTTPAQFSQRVMAVLPEKTPSRAHSLMRQFRITPVTAIATAISLLAAGAFAGKIFLR